MNQNPQERKRLIKKLLNYTATHGSPPSMAQIAEILGISSPSNAHYHIRKLQDQGYIATPSNGQRRSRQNMVTDRGIRFMLQGTLPAAYLEQPLIIPLCRAGWHPPHPNENYHYLQRKALFRPTKLGFNLYLIGTITRWDAETITIRSNDYEETIPRAQAPVLIGLLEPLPTNKRKTR